MKKHLLILFAVLISVNSASAQQYDPIEYGHKKAFILSSTQDEIYSFALEDSVAMGADTMFYQFNCSPLFNETSMNWFVPDTCFAWGSCYTNPGKSVFGRYMHKSSSGVYTFFNRDSVPLTFDFNLAPGDSSIMFANASHIFYIKRMQNIYDTVLGNNDSMKVFQVHHYDVLLNPVISSPLHLYEITLGKTAGLVNFIEVLRFPDHLNKLHLIGSTKLNAGLTKITERMIYDWQVGDTWQTHRYTVNQGPPPAPPHYYEKYIVLSVTPIANGVTYTLYREKFNSNSTVVDIDTTTFSAMDTIGIKLPFERAENYLDGPVYYKTLCGEQYLGYTTETNNGFYYCAYENAYCGLDNYPALITNTNEYLAGLGNSISIFDHYDVAWSTYNFTQYTLLNYFDVDNNTCGTEQFLGLDEILSENNFSVYPNPAEDFIYINAGSDSETEVQVLSLSGQIISSHQILPDQKLSVDHLSKGIYLLKMKTEKGTGVCKLIIY